jgi:pimeloyl-ACP methyl ester carboxylesterase
MATIEWTNSVVSSVGVELHLRRGGAGSPIVVLHRDIGSPEQLAFYDALAASHEVIIPNHPGYGSSPRAEWLANVRDLAAVYRAFLGDLGLGSATLVGLGFGGWIAAEMATFAPHDTPRLVLAGAMGIKPPVGDIFDQALVSYIEYVKEGCHDPASFGSIYGERPASEQLVLWDLCREMSFRLAWKPYMFNPSLPPLLSGVRSQALIVWGDDDRIVPPSAGTVYAECLPNARRATIANAGHLIEFEQPDAFARTIVQFIASS